MPSDKDNAPIRPRPLSLWLPVACWAAAITIATSTPGDKLPPAPFSSADLVVHALLYGILAFLLYRAINRGTRLGASRWTWFVVFAVAQSYAILDEVHQLWIPNRFCSLSDALADGVGAAVGVCIYFIRFARKARPVSSAPPQSRP